jgi:hypothetical protein
MTGGAADVNLPNDLCDIKISDYMQMDLPLKTRNIVL